MLSSQSAMGVAVAALCLFGLVRSAWLFEHTRKGRRLAAWFGESNGLAAMRAILIVGILFGALLAADVIRPVKW